MAHRQPVPDLTPGHRLARIRVRGVRPPLLAGRVASGTLTLSTSEIDSLELVLPDPDLDLLAAGVFSQGAPIAYGQIPLTVTTAGIADSAGIPTLSVTAMARGATRARADKGQLVRRHLSPTDWVRIGASHHGMSFVGEPTASRKSITRAGAKKGQPAVTEYDFWQTLAGDVGFICFESLGVVYFARPAWLMNNLPRIPVAWGSDGRVPTIPTCRRTSTDLNQPVTVGLDVADSLADQLTPGVCADISGVPTFDHHYIVTDVTIPIDDSQFATVNAASPVDPTPTGAAKGSGGARVHDFVTAALSQVGHADPAPAITNPASPTVKHPTVANLDGAELVAWAAARAGAGSVNSSPTGIYSQAQAHQLTLTVAAGKKRRGALLFAHGLVAISLGDGRVIVAAGHHYAIGHVDARSWTGAALCYGVRYK